VAKFELYGAAGCPYTREAREWLEWQGYAFVEYDVESDAAARERMLALGAGQHMVPVIVEDGKVTHVGWQGRGCLISAPHERT
jgi:glutaredoxin